MKSKNGFSFVFLLMTFLTNSVVGGDVRLTASAQTFSVTPKVGTPASHSKSGNMIEAVYGDLKTTILLFEEGPNKLCFLSSPFGVESKVLRNACVSILSKTLKISPEAIITASSHSHTIPFLLVDSTAKPDLKTPHYMSWELGQEFLQKLQQSANKLTQTLEPVTVEWGVAEENRITYNRRGRRLDGKTYFMREEDRMLAGEGYIGVIDPEAMVVVLKNKADKPVAALSLFTGHPVAAYNPEKMISYGQFPQTASEKLSNYLGGVPVAFLQGFAGDINAKHMLTGTIDQARLLGDQLGDAFIIAAKSLHKSKRTGMEWTRETVQIPLAPLPDQKSLQKDLNLIDDFIKRGNAGDENTYECVGMNFPKALTPPYRARLVDAVRPWYVWALEQHKTNKLQNVPTEMPITISVARFGDVGFVGFPFEPFVKTGLKIKKEAALPCVLTAGYTDSNYGYIPDSSSCDDREYQAGFFRYRGKTPPYQSPGGDTAATLAIEKIAQLAR
ncbi:hypothetical protein IC229_22940 [Spirosoma sp. BT702]|uniref:Neutral/alkaline non-lysosomal ceramidase N-terminal domain-containing protein n=1 Tax=Spirosoma profusum TaxID=2771354 RepID=A0A926Y4P8_9BACT|nr:hypothetical protein [Spirosoma profusum]MBD2703520.1 hypothetical protein [Spirosoma profusum]